ncbi:MAG: peptidase MA family metallohydrolase, partial [Thermoanaerobaculia bacterium]
PLVAAGVFAIAGAVVAARWRLVGVVLLALATASAIIAVRERSRKPPLPFVELRGVGPVREALARGRGAKIDAGVSKEARDVATLWMLQGGLAVEVGGTKDDPIAALASVTKTPLAEIVRARIALGDKDEDKAVRAFQRAATLPPVRDDILYEAAFSFSNERADAFLARMRALGSRDAETWYRAARDTKSYDDLRIAWTLEPKPREQLIRDHLVEDLRAKPLVSFFSSSEPVRRSASLATRPLAWPAGASAVVTGELLRVELGSAAMEIPNGAALAPKDAQVVAATHGARRRDAAALRDAQELLENGGTASRTRLVRAVKALAHHNRWADVVKLTSGSTDSIPELLVPRLRALLRAHRVDDARALAESEAARAIDDPAALVAIAEAMSNAGQWSSAETLFRAVKSEKHRPVVELRMRQLMLRRALATNAQTIATRHFDIRHDRSINPAIASRIGDLLEAERARVQKKLSPLEPRRVTVNVLRWDEFRGEITQSDHVLGLYDGEIFFPFAAVEQFRPHVVAVITHELTHALLAQATNDNAPRWFQEGVAARMEIHDRHENAFTRTPPGLVLPVTLLDATMEKNNDPSAYTVAQTFIRFLEDRYGADAIAKLATDFARGTTSDDALMKLAGKSLDALNADFREWGFHNNGEFAMEEPWPYREWYSPGVDPRVRAGFRFGKRQQ